MRILMTSDAVGGVGVYAEHLAGALARRGHAVRLVIFGHAGSGCGQDGTDASAEPGVERRRRPERLEWESEVAPATLARDIESGRKYLAGLAREWRADVLHCNQFGWVGAGGAATPSLLVEHSDVVSWWRAVHGTAPPDNAFQRWYRATVKRALKSAAAVVAPTRAAAGELCASYEMDRAVMVIAHGMPSVRLEEAAWEQRRGAVALGRWWDAAKQIHLLLRDDLGMKLMLAGDGERPAAAPAGIRWAGRLSRREVERLLGRAQVFVSASRYEPFGLAALEAATAGCCLLLNDIPSAREVWADAALYFRRNDGDDLAARMRWLAESPEVMRGAGKAARARARRLYGDDIMAKRYEQVYAGLQAGVGTEALAA